MKGFFKKFKVVKILLWIIFIVIFLILFAKIFMRAYPAFGSRPTKADREDYAKRAENYFDGKYFTYPAEWELPGVPSNNKVSEKAAIPAGPLPAGTPDFSKAQPDDPAVTWLGHSTLLIQMSGKNILIDPVFSERSSPVQWAGPKRFTPPPIDIDDLPEIDAVLITHDHYDHLDMDTIKRLESKTKNYIVPLGVEKHIKRWIADDGRVTELAWWESFALGDLEIYCAPANHKSGRALDNQQTTLFCSWVLKDAHHQIYESGDTGYGAHFEEIHKRFGDFDLFLPDCGQYNINWHYWHMFPEESAMAAETLGAKAVMPIHWGAFVLSDHGWDDPAERLTRACEEKNIEIATPKLCETMSVSETENFHERWWRECE